jgi:HSP20 family protein
MANIVKKDGNQPQTQRGSHGGLMRWDPFQMMSDLLSFDPMRMFRTAGHEMIWNPSFEIRETDDSFVFKADVPGAKSEDLEISLDGRRLEISGKREEERTEGEARGAYHAYERAYGSFTRSFMLPEQADLEHVKTSLAEGVLTVVVPKKAGTAQQKRKIQIGGGTKS